MQELINRAKELLADGTVARVLGWKAGDLPYNPEPAYFETEESLKDFVYNGFCGANLSKYMIEASKLEGKTMVCLKPCDTYSFNQLIKEHRVDRDKAYIVGVGCKGKLDIEKIKKQGIKGIQSIQGAEITAIEKSRYGSRNSRSLHFEIRYFIPVKPRVNSYSTNTLPTKHRKKRILSMCSSGSDVTARLLSSVQVTISRNVV